MGRPLMRLGVRAFGGMGLAVLVGATAAILVVTSGAASGTPEPGGTDASPAVVRELPQLRTARSDTYLRTDGTELAKVFVAPVNYRDAAGTWQPVDTTLRPG